jgi:hypothetical protein
MKKDILQKKLAKLEFINDQLQTEINHIDRLLREVGFPDGLTSAKLIAQEMLEEQQNRREEI